MTVIKAKSSAEAGLEREVYNLLFQHFQAEKGNWSAACQEFDLTLPQAQLLRSLTPATPIKMNGLAEALDCDASNITGLVDKLEVRRIIRRQSESGDRRVKMIALTPAGIRLRAKLSERLSQPSASITCLSLTDKRALRRIVKQMVGTAAQQRMEGPVPAQLRARRAVG